MSPSARFSPSRCVRRTFVRAGFLLTFVSLSACANSDKPPTPGPDKPTVAVPELAPEAKLAEEKATAEKKAADEKEAAEKKAAEEKAAADTPAAEEKASVKEAEPKAGDTPKAEAKAKTPDQAKDAPKDASKDSLAKPTNFQTKTGVLAKGEADKYVKEGARPLVRLLDAGAEPRSPAAYAVTKGSTKPLQMGMELELSLEMAGQKVPATKMPRTLLTFKFTAGDRAGSEWPIDGQLSKLGLEAIDPSQDQAIKLLGPEIEKIQNVAVHYFLDQTGRTRDIKLKLPPSLPPMAEQMLSGMTQSIEAMTAPLPDKPIGIGAKWEVFSRIAANGADLLQVSTYTLEKREGSLLTLDSVTRQYAAKNRVTSPGLPPEAKARLASFQSEGKGKPVFDLSDVAPKSGTLRMQSSMIVEVVVDVDGETEKQKSSFGTKVVATYTRPST